MLYKIILVQPKYFLPTHCSVAHALIEFLYFSVIIKLCILRYLDRLNERIVSIKLVSLLSIFSHNQSIVQSIVI